jgi:hypothetical protein
MSKRRIGVLVGACAIFVLAALAASILWVPRSSAQAGTESFTIVGVLKRGADSSNRLKPASSEVLVWNLRNEAQTAKVGRQLDHCVFEFGGRQYCQSAFRIAGRGKIIAEGFWNPGLKVNKLPVTGGSGDFTAVGGVASFRPAPSNGPEKVSVAFELVR